MPELNTVRSLISATEPGKEAEVNYEYSYTGETKSYRDTVVSSERGLWCKFRVGPNTSVQVFGHEIADREPGCVAENRERVGEFVSARVISNDTAE